MRVLQLVSYAFSLLLTSRSVQSRSTTATVTLSLSAPSNAPTISPSLVSLSIEAGRWTDWAGTTSPNQFTYNVLDNLKGLTGVPPQIRIGADTADHTVFDSSVQFSTATFPDPTVDFPYPEALNVSIGDGYYQTAQFLPAGTHVGWGLNLGANNITNSVLQAQSLMKAFNSREMKTADVVLDFIELGNEPDVYAFHGFRPSTYSAINYTNEWIKMAMNVSQVAGITGSTSHTKFLVGGFAGFPGLTLEDFSPQAIYAAGILDSEPGKFITIFSQHHYSGLFLVEDAKGALQDLMSKATIRSNLSAFERDIEATHAKGLEYVLGETNSIPGHGAAGVSNTAGAALWALDYTLFATQLGISRVFFNEGIGYKYNLIQPVELTRSPLDASPLPVPLPPHVQPQYYAAVIAGEAIGKSGSTQAVEIPIDNTRLAGYAFYEHGKLARALFINSQAHFANATRREVIHVYLDFEGSLTAEAGVKRLAIGLSDDVSGLTWGGQSYETPDGRVQGQLQVDNIKVADGVNVQDSEAVLISFK